MTYIVAQENEEILKLKAVAIDLSKEDPELFKYLQEYSAFEKRQIEATSSWYRSGLAITPQTGGEWISSSPPLTPISKPPATALITQVKYSYSKAFGSWANQVSVRLYIVSSGSTYYYDITSNTSGTIDASSLKAKADCQILFSMKVGNMKSRLYNPPSIPTCDVTVYYQ